MLFRSTGIYDFTWVGKQGQEAKSDRTLIVDVGGGKGQALKAILEGNTMLPPSRCVLQDRADVIQSVVDGGDAAGVLRSTRKQVASLFNEQPTKGESFCDV